MRKTRIQVAATWHSFIQAGLASRVGLKTGVRLEMKTILAAMIGLAVLPAFAQEWNADTCRAGLEHAYATFSARAGASTAGDFNGDHQEDFALLLDDSLKHRSAIGVCLSREPRVLLITAPYQSSRIFTKPKGTAYMNFETEKKGAYELDAISVSDGAWIGASYILRAGVFARVIDGD